MELFKSFHKNEENPEKAKNDIKHRRNGVLIPLDVIARYYGEEKEKEALP
jgi:hypothetical protein